MARVARLPRQPGLHQPDPDRFLGTAGQIKEAFHTSIHQLDVKGQMHFANMGDPRIPAALAPVVKGIVSLNDFRPEAMHKSVRRDYTSAGCLTSLSDSSGTCYDITPQDDAVIYNTNPLWSQGITGAARPSPWSKTPIPITALATGARTCRRSA